MAELSRHILFLQCSHEGEQAAAWRKVGQGSHRCIPPPSSSSSSRNLIHWEEMIHLSFMQNSSSVTIWGFFLSSQTRSCIFNSVDLLLIFTRLLQVCPTRSLCFDETSPCVLIQRRPQLSPRLPSEGCGCICSTSMELCGYWSSPDTFTGLGVLEGGTVGYKGFFKDEL